MYSLQQKVLVISADESDRETMRLLLGSMGCGWMLASSVEEGLKILNREPVAAAIVDSGILTDRSLESWPDVVNSLSGRVLLLLGATEDARVLKFAQEKSLPSIKLDRLAKDLWASLESLLRRLNDSSCVVEMARLIADTFFQPLPGGIRDGYSTVRHLLYETRSLSVDVSIECLPDSKSMALAGQILSKATAARTFAGTRVTLLGHEGLLGFDVTNQFGEFLFEFEQEPKVVLEIEDVPNHRVAIHSPNLSDWMAKSEQAGTGREARITRRTRAAVTSRRPDSDRRKINAGHEPSSANS